MHKSIFTFGLLASSLVMLSVMPFLNNNWIRIEKKRIEELRYNPPQDSVLLYQDEKGPIAAKTYSGPSWCSTQTKIEKAQKIYFRAWAELCGWVMVGQF